LVDLDRDGRTDVLSGSWPGEIYFFRRKADGTFAMGQKLKDKAAQELNVGSGSAVFAVDWNSDGAVDLVVGNVLGEVYLIPNEGKPTPKSLVFGTPRRLLAAGKPIKVNGDASPAVADWDGDGKLDLIVGAEDGSVVWYRNIGSVQEPRLDVARPLIAKSPLGWGWDNARQPGDWGLRVKICVTDWNGDGRLDILLGDRCGGFMAKPQQTAKEKAEENRANDQLPRLRRDWAATFKEYRRLDDTPATAAVAGVERGRTLDALRDKLRRLKDEIALVQEIQSRYRPGYQTHGFVWLFLRRPALTKLRHAAPPK
jgi:hypothetical protein